MFFERHTSRGCYEREGRVICRGDMGAKNMYFCETNRIWYGENADVSYTA